MSPEHNKQVILRVFEEIVNKANYGLIPELYNDDFLDHDPVPGSRPGLEAAQQSIEQLRRAMPDMRVTVEDISAHGDKVVIHNTWKGTHTGSFLGFPPSGRRLEYTGIVIWRLADGRISERWALIDKREMARQMSSGESAAPAMDTALAQ
jgi:steroid delta-isomerase-like uncharacterized protein